MRSQLLKTARGDPILILANAPPPSSGDLKGFGNSGFAGIAGICWGFSGYWWVLVWGWCLVLLSVGGAVFALFGTWVWFCQKALLTTPAGTSIRDVHLVCRVLFS